MVPNPVSSQMLWMMMMKTVATNDDGGYENCIDVDNGDGVDEMSDKSDFC